MFSVYWEKSRKAERKGEGGTNKVADEDTISEAVWNSFAEQWKGRYRGDKESTGIPVLVFSSTNASYCRVASGRLSEGCGSASIAVVQSGKKPFSRYAARSSDRPGRDSNAPKIAPPSHATQFGSAGGL